MSTLTKFYSGDTVALARVISHIENRGPETDRILAELYPKTGKALSIGVTGPPGSGKSTMVDKLCALLTARGQTVGVIAVDPTSPFTGGALLGDRIRMQDLAANVKNWRNEMEIADYLEKILAREAFDQSGLAQHLKRKGIKLRK